eukprot:Nitzschia sp. Nitz4//scaffold121_size67750//40517//41394//NITZ4_006070-RA/size67750-augustus-gene-0.129-mRNA-1//-1//CDS//3329534357//6662//frame0
MMARGGVKVQFLLGYLTLLVGTLLTSGNGFVIMSPLYGVSKASKWPSREGVPSTVVHETGIMSTRKKSDVDSETVAGAFIGGILGGPVGVLLGAQLGKSYGELNRQAGKEQEEQNSAGQSTTTLEAREALNNARSALHAIQTSLQVQREYALRLESDMAELVAKAREAILSGNDEEAQFFLLEKNTIRDKLDGVLKHCCQEDERAIIVQQQIRQLEAEVIERENDNIKRSMNANESTTGDIAGDTANSTIEDPLLKKFRDIGIN